MKTLLTNATVLTLDPDIGDLTSGQVLVEDDRIWKVDLATTRRMPEQIAHSREQTRVA